MKTLVLLSGGLDSATCLALAIEKYGHKEVLALSILYGQKHRKELEAAKKLAAYYHVGYHQLDLTVLFKESDCSLLISSFKEIPHETYQKQLSMTQEGPVSTYVPFRNGLFLSCAASIALSYKCKNIFYGIHSDDAIGNVYPDTSPQFHYAMQEAIFLGSGQTLIIEAPFLKKTKANIVKKGIDLGVPYELTWSCYEGKEKACGKCGTCRDRKKAFELNGINDPITYEGK